MEQTQAIEALSALAHSGRLGVFRLLVRAGRQGLAAGDIARAAGSPANTTSTHLSILNRAGLIRSRRDSRSIIYRAEYDQIRDLLAFLMADCCQGRPEICAPLTQAVICAQTGDGLDFRP